jgi:hypothetical protein
MGDTFGQFVEIVIGAGRMRFDHSLGHFHNKLPFSK